MNRGYLVPMAQTPGNAGGNGEGWGPGALLLVLSGPSGVGKTTIVREIAQRTPGAALSVSLTTRPKTPREVDGADYHFVTEVEFERRIRNPDGAQGLGDFLEHAGVYGKRYGTLRAPVEEGLREGRLVILEIDVQGAKQVKARMPGAFCVFVMPPSEPELLERLRGRGRDSEEAVQKRFALAKREMDEARACGVYDVFLVNDDLERTITQAMHLIEEERRVRWQGVRSRS